MWIFFFIFLNLFYLGNRENASEYGSQLSMIQGKQNYFFPNILWLNNMVQLLIINCIITKPQNSVYESFKKDCV